MDKHSVRRAATGRSFACCTLIGLGWLAAYSLQAAREEAAACRTKGLAQGTLKAETEGLAHGTLKTEREAAAACWYLGLADGSAPSHPAAAARCAAGLAHSTSHAARCCLLYIASGWLAGSHSYRAAAKQEAPAACQSAPSSSRLQGGSSYTPNACCPGFQSAAGTHSAHSSSSNSMPRPHMGQVLLRSSHS